MSMLDRNQDHSEENSFKYFIFNKLGILMLLGVVVSFFITINLMDYMNMLFGGALFMGWVAFAIAYHIKHPAIGSLIWGLTIGLLIGLLGS